MIAPSQTEPIAEPLPHTSPHLELDVAAAVQLYESCLRCMYLHAHGDPRLPVEAENPYEDQLDELMRSLQESGRWIELNFGPRFRLVSHRGTVLSAPIAFQLAEVQYSGTYDAIAELSDGRKILLKYVLPEQLADATRYQRQLAALGYALEHPADPQIAPVAIDGYALLGFVAHQVMVRAHVQKQLAPMRWTEIDRRPDRFLAFMRVVTCIVGLAHEPRPAPGCPRCKRHRRDTGVTPLTLKIGT